jgi:6-phosphogluconolactonase/glucosamine-6-phosphate isomerase/deaminase
MQTIKSADASEGVKALANRIIEDLERKGKVVWLLSGGSNSKATAETLALIESKIPAESLKENLIVTLADERYGEPGHTESNWTKIKAAGFDFEKVKSYPVLQGFTAEETARKFGETTDMLFSEAKSIIGNFGLGEDGHIAGVLPHSAGVIDTSTAITYFSDPFTRLTLTLKTLGKIHAGYMFVFGSNKKADAIKNLTKKEMSLGDCPSQILKKIPESFLFTDQEI